MFLSEYLSSSVKTGGGDRIKQEYIVFLPLLLKKKSKKVDQKTPQEVSEIFLTQLSGTKTIFKKFFCQLKFLYPTTPSTKKFPTPLI